MGTKKITIHADISADTKKVWDYYMLPEHITQWNFASSDWHCPKAENDIRVGGKYSARMEAKDGSWGFDFEAVYDVVVEYKNFIYTMPDGRKVTVNFENNEDRTRVVVTFDAETENSEELQRNGWQAILNNFKKYTEAN
ncbi:MAG TPA: SRPBCC family protein [Draconibacterium sp.]|nr:SRPBCC family protein [Draconibacterium sp.]